MLCFCCVSRDFVFCIFDLCIIIECAPSQANKIHKQRASLEASVLCRGYQWGARTVLISFGAAAKAITSTGRLRRWQLLPAFPWQYAWPALPRLWAFILHATTSTAGNICCMSNTHTLCPSCHPHFTLTSLHVLQLRAHFPQTDRLRLPHKTQWLWLPTPSGGIKIMHTCT